MGQRGWKQKSRREALQGPLSGQSFYRWRLSEELVPEVHEPPRGKVTDVVDAGGNPGHG